MRVIKLRGMHGTAFLDVETGEIRPQNRADQMRANRRPKTQEKRKFEAKKAVKSVGSSASKNGRKIRRPINEKKESRKWSWHLTYGLGKLLLVIIIMAGTTGLWPIEAAWQWVYDQANSQGGRVERITYPKPLIRAVVSVETVEAESEAPTPTPTPKLEGRDYYVQALNEEAEKAGVSKKLIDRLVKLVDECENHTWDATRVHTNEDGTQDHGAFQVNNWWHAQRVADIYGVSFESAMLDPDLSTHYVVHYILKPQGNTSAWACDRKVK